MRRLYVVADYEIKDVFDFQVVSAVGLSWSSPAIFLLLFRFLFAPEPFSPVRTTPGSSSLSLLQSSPPSPRYLRFAALPSNFPGSLGADSRAGTDVFFFLTLRGFGPFGPFLFFLGGPFVESGVSDFKRALSDAVFELRASSSA